MSALTDSVRLYNRFDDCRYMDSLQTVDRPFFGEFMRQCMRMTFQSENPLQNNETVTKLYNGLLELYDSGHGHAQWLLNRYWECTQKRVSFYQANGINSSDDYRLADVCIRCEGTELFKQCIDEPMPPGASWMHVAAQVMLPVSVLLLIGACRKGNYLQAAALTAASVGLSYCLFG
jgi:hypothetical protein